MNPHGLARAEEARTCSYAVEAAPGISTDMAAACTNSGVPEENSPAPSSARDWRVGYSTQDPFAWDYHQGQPRCHNHMRFVDERQSTFASCLLVLRCTTGHAAWSALLIALPATQPPLPRRPAARTAVPRTLPAGLPC
eukprot:353562-Chlamydomonas_euryale.AAC.2